MRRLWELYSAFFRIGLFTFGGGYSMLPMLEREVVEKHGWSTRAELLDYFAIGQAMPGIIAVNTATLVGHSQRRAAGAAAAALGVVTPSIIVILIIAAVLEQFMHLPVVAHAFGGIRVAVCALIVAAVIKLFTGNVLQKRREGERTAAWLGRSAAPLLLCLAAFLAVALLGASPVYVVVGAAVAGLLLYGRRGDGDA